MKRGGEGLWSKKERVGGKERGKEPKCCETELYNKICMYCMSVYSGKYN